MLLYAIFEALRWIDVVNENDYSTLKQNEDCKLNLFKLLDLKESKIYFQIPEMFEVVCFSAHSF